MICDLAVRRKSKNNARHTCATNMITDAATRLAAMRTQRNFCARLTAELNFFHSNVAAHALAFFIQRHRAV